MSDNDIDISDHESDNESDNESDYHLVLKNILAQLECSNELRIVEIRLKLANGEHQKANEVIDDIAHKYLRYTDINRYTGIKRN